MEVVINKKTPSINHLYGFRGYRRFIKKEGVEIKKYIESIINKTPNNYELNSIPLTVEVEIYENWLTKKRQVARKDIANREKFLIDSVFNALGLDDRFIFKHIMKKVQSKEEKAIVKIYENKDMQIL